MVANSTHAAAKRSIAKAANRRLATDCRTRSPNHCSVGGRFRGQAQCGGRQVRHNTHDGRTVRLSSLIESLEDRAATQHVVSQGPRERFVDDDDARHGSTIVVREHSTGLR
jgi:hypothetical protein